MPGMTQFLVDLATPGITVRPIHNLADEHDFNEVAFDRVFVPDDRVIGEIGNGWNQVTSELAFERSGPERWLSTYRRCCANWWTRSGRSRAPRRRRRSAGSSRNSRRCAACRSRSRACSHEGETPNVEAAVVKDLGTNFEQEIPAVARGA